MYSFYNSKIGFEGLARVSNTFFNDSTDLVNNYINIIIKKANGPNYYVSKSMFEK